MDNPNYQEPEGGWEWVTGENFSNDFWAEINLDYEVNSKKTIITDSLTLNSHQYKSHGVKSGIGEKEKLFVEIGYNHIINDSVVNNSIQKVNTSNNFSISSSDTASSISIKAIASPPTFVLPK